MCLIAVDHKYNVLMTLWNLIIEGDSACLVDFLKDFDGVLKCWEEVEILDWKIISPILLVVFIAFPHEGNLFQMIFKILAIFIKCPILIYDLLAKDVDPQALLDLFLVLLLQQLYHFMAVILYKPIQLVPVRINKSLKVQYILKEGLAEPLLVFFIDIFAILEFLYDPKQLPILAHLRVGSLFGVIQHQLAEVIESFLDKAELCLKFFPVFLIKFHKFMMPIYN